MKKEIFDMYHQLEQFPKFVDGQLLSSQDLNNSFEHLENQLRKTRTILFGYGIINGFGYVLDNEGKEIKIEKGKAITRSGDIIDIDKDQIFRYVATKEGGFWVNGKKYDYLLLKDEIAYGTKEKISCISIDKIENISDYYLVVFVEELEEQVDKCNEISCNINKTNTKRICGVFLKKVDEKEKNHRPPKADILQIHNPTNMANSKELSVFLRKTVNYFYYCIGQIKTSIETTHFDESEKIIKRLDKLRPDTTNMSPYLSFISDLSKATCEYIESYNRSKSIYDEIEKRTNCIVLGKVKEYNDIHKNRDSLVEFVRGNDMMKNNIILKRQQQRLLNMVRCFRPNDKRDATQKIKIDFTQNRSLLGERQIPEYYSYNEGVNKEAFYEYWDAHNYIHIDKSEQQQSTGDIVLLSEYGGMPIKAFSEEMNRLIDVNNLPIDLVRFDLEGLRESFILENYDRNILQTGDTIIDIIENKEVITKCINILKALQLSHNKDKPQISKNIISKIEISLDNYSKNKQISELYSTLGYLNNCELEELKQAIYLSMKNDEKAVEKKDKLTLECRRILKFLLRTSTYLSEQVYCIRDIVSVQLSYQDRDNISSNICSAVTECLKASFPDYRPEVIRNSISKLNGIEKEELRQSIYLLMKNIEKHTKNKHETAINKYLLSLLARYMAYDDTINFYNGAEYIGGCTPNSVLVAVCYDQKVQLCLNMGIFDYIAYKETSSSKNIFQPLRNIKDAIDHKIIDNEFKINFL